MKALVWKRGWCEAAAGRRAGQHTFVRQHSAPSTSMIIASMMHPPGDCRQERAEEMIQLALMSRRDYAQWHSYELHLATRRLGWGIAESSVLAPSSVPSLPPPLWNTCPALDSLQSVCAWLRVGRTGLTSFHVCIGSTGCWDSIMHAYRAYSIKQQLSAVCSAERAVEQGLLHQEDSGHHRPLRCRVDIIHGGRYHHRCSRVHPAL